MPTNYDELKSAIMTLTTYTPCKRCTKPASSCKKCSWYTSLQIIKQHVKEKEPNNGRSN